MTINEFLAGDMSILEQPARRFDPERRTEESQI
jgi:hypothetical protein